MTGKRRFIAVIMALTFAGAAQADELCNFIDQVGNTPAETVKGDVLEENVTVGNFTIYGTQMRPPLDGFRDCVLEERTKGNGAVSRLLVCYHGEGEHGSPLPPEQFESISERLDSCTDAKGLGSGNRRMWRLRDHELQRVDLVSNNRGAHLAFIYPEGKETAQEKAVGDQVADGRPSGDSGGICAVISSMDLPAAFDDVLTFGETQQRYETVCTVPVQGAAGPGLTIQVVGAGSFEQKAAMSRDQELPLKKIEDLGQEAFLVNEADLNVLINGRTSISIKFSALYTDGRKLPHASLIEAGLTKVARAVLTSLSV